MNGCTEGDAEPRELFSESRTPWDKHGATTVVFGDVPRYFVVAQGPMPIRMWQAGLGETGCRSKLGKADVGFCNAVRLRVAGLGLIVSDALESAYPLKLA